MRVLVCGSRTFTDFPIVEKILDGFYGIETSWNNDLTVIHGDANGADHCARQFCQPPVHRLIEERYPADWGQHGKAAGVIRNQQMLDEGKPDLVLAFVDKPLEESRGTADMVRRAQQAGVPTYVIRKMT